jgi:ribulose-phosphate 3-epimerase
VTVRISGSLWSVPGEDQPTAAERLAGAGLEHLHWDLTDGVFAPQGGFEPDTACRLTELVGVGAEAHLMVTDPIRHVDAWTDFCEVVVVHAEARDHASALRRIERRGARPAVAVAPGTPLPPSLSPDLAVLVMSVQPGWGGSTFLPQTYERIQALAGPRLLGVDGGVGLDEAGRSRSAGANWIVSGTALLGAADPADWITTVRQAAEPPPPDEIGSH